MMNSARIQVRKNGRVIGYLTPKGSINRLRVHAAVYPLNRAYIEVAILADDNPNYGFSVQEEK